MLRIARRGRHHMRKTGLGELLVAIEDLAQIEDHQLHRSTTVLLNYNKIVKQTS